MRRLLALPVLLLGAVVAPATPARAAGPGEAVVFEADGSLYRAATDFSGPVKVAEESGELGDLRSSGDGSRLTYLTTQRGSKDRPHDYRTRIVVRDVSGRQVRVVDEVVGYYGGDVVSGPTVAEPSLSFDGMRVLWVGPNGWVSSSVASGSGSPVTTSKTRISDVRFVDPHDDVLAMAGSTIVQVRTGSVTPVAGLPAYAQSFEVSPDGNQVVYTYGGGTFVYGATLTRAPDGTLSAGEATSLTSVPVDQESLRFSRDGTKLWWSTPDRDIDEIPATGGQTTKRTTTPGSLETVAVGVALDDGAPPGVVTLPPFEIGDQYVTVRWTLPTDSDLSGVVITASGDGAYRYPVAFVPAPLTSFQVYTANGATYDVMAVDRSGNTSGVTTRIAYAYGTFAHFSTPTALSSVSADYLKITLPAFTARNSLWYRSSPTGPLIQLRDKKQSSLIAFTKGVPGQQYGFLVQTFDPFDNATKLTGAGIAVVPYDQNRAAYSGSFTTQARSDRWLGSATILKTGGSAARFAVTGRQVQVIGERCSSCGAFDLYVDGKHIRGVDTYSSTRKVRQVLFTYGLGAGSHSVVMKLRGTPRHPWVVVDGIAVLR